MARLLVHLEGQTEETFVNEILRDYLVSRGYDAVGARIIGNARLRRRRGGIRAWPTVKRDIINHLKDDPMCIATTMVDYYGLPQEGNGAWPGRKAAAALKSAKKAPSVEKALLDDVVAEMGGGFNPQRFVPFVVMHEFEGLLFSDCAGFSRGIGRPELEAAFQAVRDEFPTPEDINDSPITAPSKRVEDLVPGYEKPLLGSLAALEIGLASIRQECPHFNSWLVQLESRIG
ncbi:MAG: DUF4276 family protein [Acidobacteriia bacterium]|nr:DUF4276 family protein [Terriglobia bacterium]